MCSDKCFDICLATQTFCQGPYNWTHCVKQLEVSALAALQLVTIHFVQPSFKRQFVTVCTQICPVLILEKNNQR